MARIAGINIPQNKIVSIALTYIHGIGLHSSKKICEKLNISNKTKINDLTEEQVLQIRDLYKQGFSTNVIARNFKVSKWNVEEIVKKKTWTHL